TGATPAVPLPNTMTPNGSTLTTGGGVADGAAAKDDLLPGVPTINTITPDTGLSTQDRITNSNTVSLNGTAPTGYAVQIFQIVLNSTGGVTSRSLLGTAVAQNNKWSFALPGPLSDGSYTYAADGYDLSGTLTGTSAQFTVTVDTQAPAQP